MLNKVGRQLLTSTPCALTLLTHRYVYLADVLLHLLGASCRHNLLWCLECAYCQLFPSERNGQGWLGLAPAEVNHDAFYQVDDKLMLHTKHLRSKSPNTSILMLVCVGPAALVKLLTGLNCLEPHTDSACIRPPYKMSQSITQLTAVYCGPAADSAKCNSGCPNPLL